VTEGVVSVQHAGHELLLDAGSEWTSAVANPPVATHDVPSASKPGPFKPASPTHEDRRAASPERPSPEHKAGNVRGASGVDPTELANQNRLFAEAMSARDRGDGAHAVALLEDFVRKYPVCPLTEDAYVARFRVLSRMGDRAGAAKAARGYLALYPDGLAGQEARALSFAAGPGLE
jgi:TolA-binding protein